MARTEAPYGSKGADESVALISRRNSEEMHPPTILATTTLSVGGMTCSACTSAVERCLREQPGVEDATVALLSEIAVVKHGTSTSSPGQLADAIEDRGFTAKVLESVTPDSGGQGCKLNSCDRNEPQTVISTISVEGMTCGACVASIQRRFQGGMDGLVHFGISLLAERASVTHDQTVLTAEEIVEIIEGSGFDAKLVSSLPHTDVSRNTSTVALNVDGLCDAPSAAALEEILVRKPGIMMAVTTVTESQLRIAFQPSVIGIREVIDEIVAAGYTATVSSGENSDSIQTLAKTREIRQWKIAFLFSLCCAIPVFFISMIFPLYLPRLDFGALELLKGLYLGDLVCLLLTIPVQFGVGKRFYISSWVSLKHKSPTMDVLVVLGTSTAFFYSCFTMLFYVIRGYPTRPSTVFDTSTMLITFITLGRWLENRAKSHTSAALSRLMSLAPSTTTIYEDPIAAEKRAESCNTGKDNLNLDMASAGPESTIASPATALAQRSLPTELLQVGDMVVLRPGDKIPADGLVVRGSSYADESMITGEPLPVQKEPGSQVAAGTVNDPGSLDFKVSRVGADTQLSQIIKLVQDAQAHRAPIQRIADIVAGYFVPVIIGLGLLTFFGWLILCHVLHNPPRVFLEESGGKIMVCLKLCIAVIVFACPCALGLSTPTAIMVGTGVGAEQGILIKGGAILEAATKASHVVFDKTGTLTSGRMSVTDVEMPPPWSARAQTWWTVVGLAEMSSEHPIGKAIYERAMSESAQAPADKQELPGALIEFNNTVGKGVSATVDTFADAERRQHHALVGNSAFLGAHGVPVPGKLDPDAPARAMQSGPSRLHRKTARGFAGMTMVHVAIDSLYAGTIFLSDSVKPSSKAAVAALHRMGLSTYLVTGDSYSAAVTIATAVGIPPSAVHASVSPAGKQAFVESLEASGHRTIMVGDGINDSPALATAAVGISLASGTDVAVEAADIVLMQPDDMLSVASALCLCRSVLTRIKINLAWACLYNLIGLPFAMGLLLPVGIMLPPMAAGAAMAASSVSVVTSSLLLKLWKRPSWMTVEKLEAQEQGAPLKPLPERAGLNCGILRAISYPWTVLRGRGPGTADPETGYIPLQTIESSV